MILNLARQRAILFLASLATLVAVVAPAALACTPGDEQRAIQVAIREVGADRDTHIFVAVAEGSDCDDWKVYKKTPGTTGVTACIVTIQDWQVVDVTCCPTGC